MGDGGADIQRTTHTSGVSIEESRRGARLWRGRACSAGGEAAAVAEVVCLTLFAASADCRIWFDPPIGSAHILTRVSPVDSCHGRGRAPHFSHAAAATLDSFEAHASRSKTSVSSCKPPPPPTATPPRDASAAAAQSQRRGLRSCEAFHFVSIIVVPFGPRAGAGAGPGPNACWARLGSRVTHLESEQASPSSMVDADVQVAKGNLIYSPGACSVSGRGGDGFGLKRAAASMEGRDALSTSEAAAEQSDYARKMMSLVKVLLTGAPSPSLVRVIKLQNTRGPAPRGR